MSYKRYAINANITNLSYNQS